VCAIAQKEDTLIRRLAALLAAFGMTLMLAAPALAVDLHQTPPISSDSSAFPPGDGDCDGVQSGQVLWHFVVIGSSTSDTVTVTFTTAGTQTLTATKTLDNVQHYDVTTGPDTLISASSSGTNGQLNLSHICNGGPPPVIPEAPASALLVLTAGLIGLGFAGWKMRRSASAA
jgi:hypothetical protein